MHFPRPTVKQHDVVGVDLGVKELATLSTGVVFPNPKHYKTHLEKLRRLSRNFARKTKGSNNRYKAKIQLARHHAKVANLRNNTIHQMTTYLCKNHARIVVEDLNVSGMLSNHKLAQVIADCGFHELKRQKVEKSQILKEETEKPQEVPNQETPKKKGGRPKVSKNKDKKEVNFTSELLRIRSLMQDLLKKLNKFLPLTYLVLDGHFGNNSAVVMARQLGLQLICKMRSDSALYIPYQNPDPNRKCRRKYGDKIDYSSIPENFLKKTETADNIRTDIYQAQLLHKEFSQALNVVILVRTNIETSSRTHAVLFSTDLNLSYDKVIDYYSLRFQIEFNFRDAKQFWGLEDFMNVGKNAVTNAANLAFFMVNVSQVLLSYFRQFNPDFSITDLKAMFQGYKYVEETIKLISGKTRPNFTCKYFPQSYQSRTHPPCLTLFYQFINLAKVLPLKKEFITVEVVVIQWTGI